MIAIARNSTLWLLLATAGYIVWSIAFVFLYAFQGFACASGLGNSAISGVNLATAVLVFIWLAHLAAGGTLIAFAHRSRTMTGNIPGADTRRFLADLAFLLSAAGMVSTLYIGAPVLFLDPCG